MSFWQDKRVLVTGGHGFFGKHVVNRLEQVGATVIAPTKREYDLRNITAVRVMLGRNSVNVMPGGELYRYPDVVIHMAALAGGIGANISRPGDFFYDNAMMGIQLMNECMLVGINKFITIGTVCSYPKHTPVPFMESDLWNGYPEETNAPYGLAKKMLLVQGQAYRQQYNFNAVYLIPVNLYGPGDNFDLKTSHVIPALIRKFSEAKEQGNDLVVLWGDGSPTREFLFVDDAARAIVLATEHYDGGDPINIGSGHEISIYDLAHLIAKKVGYTGEIEWDTTQPNGQPRRVLDTMMAKECFGFEADITLSDGLDRTIEWYDANQ